MELPRNEFELLSLFNAYDFRDRQGHPLCHCMKFMHLVEEYCRMKEELIETGKKEGL